MGGHHHRVRSTLTRIPIPSIAFHRVAILAATDLCLYYQTSRHSLVRISPSNAWPPISDSIVRHSEGGVFKATLSFPPEYPLQPPKMKFITPMWHPNIYADGNVCISILVSTSFRASPLYPHAPCSCASLHSMLLALTSTVTRTPASAGYRSTPSSLSCVLPAWIRSYYATTDVLSVAVACPWPVSSDPQLISVISLLSSDKPNCDSPANVDAAVRRSSDLASA